MKIRYAGGTHVGMKRGHNEDSFFLLADQNLYVVADGMGGHNSGEVASQVAVETLANFFRETENDEDLTWPFKEDPAMRYEENRLSTGIKLANLRIYEMAASDEKHRGMGTTIVSLYFGKEGAYLGHVGDSRGYRVRAGEIAQMTEDHSLLNDYLKVHKLTQKEIENFPHKNVIVRALGMKDSVVVDVKRLDLRSGDFYMLCSDGLSGMVPDDFIRDTVVKNGDNIEQSVQDLIALANKNGGLDNVTVVLVQAV
jgi:serine/threonine protein phosphatase PrpC